MFAHYRNVETLWFELADPNGTVVVTISSLKTERTDQLAAATAGALLRVHHQHLGYDLPSQRPSDPAGDRQIKETLATVPLFLLVSDFICVFLAQGKTAIIAPIGSCFVAAAHTARHFS